MSAKPHSVWQWKAFKPGKRPGKVLRWSMTDEQAAEFAKREGVRLEKVTGSEEIRTPREIYEGGLMRNLGMRK